METGEFQGKVAAVTGASGGIGGTTARLLALRGASVALLDLKDTARIADSLSKEFGVQTKAIKMDVTDPQAVQQVFADIVSWKGRLDFCVNAAGIFPIGNRIDGTELGLWTKVMDINLNGVFYCLREEIRTILHLGIEGSIVNLSSDAGTVSSVGCAPYVASKHAVNGLTKSAAIEYAKSGIRVNAVAPGNIDTAMIQNFGISTADLAKVAQPTGRCGRPEEVAELICFILSDRSSFMTGSIVAIDGGITTTGYGSSDSHDAFTS
ncbi:unnamed protein product [Clonostachys solani]|uniref:Uncharacterized protein n=1 Tax=Clonostachys solani TaxID=160281 RepID=A0A9N9Z8J5_9HYPO|nr:unnamed protein product [Clonostachys solani]